MTATWYRFYLQRNGHSFAAEVLECESDSAALEKAKELLSMSTAFHLMEVWQGSRKVGVVERGCEAKSSLVGLPLAPLASCCPAVALVQSFMRNMQA
jgi:hypothetical protein